MASSLTFLGKTAIVTGAGGGIGRAYALELAKRGCRVIVNDLGGTVSGNASSIRLNPAAVVAKEIIDGGGKAVANNSSVLDGQSIVEHALKEFGSCDILINNAGILRDRSFAKMTKDDWKAVLDVHLEGTFALCHAAWPVMQKQNYGRIINVGSASGLYGNFGQANYSSAKMAVLGLTNTLALEGEKNNIRVNCVVPVAASRMTENLLPPAMFAMLDPAHIVPIVTYLAHQDTEASGECFEVGGGWFSKVRFQRSAGRSLVGENSTPATAEQIALNFESIGDFTRSSYPTTPADALREMVAAQEYEKNPAGSSSGSNEVAQEETAVDQGPLLSDSLFKALQNLATTDKSKVAELVKSIGARVSFQVSSADESTVKFWILDLKDEAQFNVRQTTREANKAAKTDVLLICGDKTFLNMANGSLSPEFAYMRGQLKIKGQMAVALKVKALLAVAAKLSNAR